MMHLHGSGCITTLAAGALVLMVAGCPTTQNPMRQVEDNMIHAAVKAKLTAERFSNLMHVDVHVPNGGMTLTGEVPNAQVKAKAEREARSVAGVMRVINHLHVKVPAP